MEKKTARKSCGNPPTRNSTGFGSGHSAGDIEILDSDVLESRQLNNSNNSNSSISKPTINSNSSPMKVSSDITPMELQIRQVELLEEQCDSLEKLVEIAAEHRDIQREMLEIKKRKLAILEKNSKQSSFD